MKKIFLLLLLEFLVRFGVAQTADSSKSINYAGKGFYIEASIGTSYPTVPSVEPTYPPFWYVNTGIHFDLVGNYMFSPTLGVLVLIDASFNSYNSQAANSYNVANYDFHTNIPYKFIEYLVGINPSIPIGKIIIIQFTIAGGVFTMDSPPVDAAIGLKVRDGSVINYFGYNGCLGILGRLNEKISLILKLSYTDAIIPGNLYESNPTNFGLIEPSLGVRYKF